MIQSEFIRLRSADGTLHVRRDDVSLIEPSRVEHRKRLVDGSCVVLTGGRLIYAIDKPANVMRKMRA
jgi:hypothetical protein